MQENPYEAAYAPDYRVAAVAEEWERSAFIRRTYIHLFAAVAAFALIEACAVAAGMGHAESDRYWDAAGKAVRFIEAMQHNDGGSLGEDDSIGMGVEGTASG